MKKKNLWKWLTVMMVATLGIFITSCNPDPDPEPELSVSTTYVDMEASGGTSRITVTAKHTEWISEVTEGREWIKILNVDKQSVNIRIEANTVTKSRTGNIKVQATVDPNLHHIITINQKEGKASLKVTPSSVSFAKDGGSKTLTVESNTEWEVNGGNDWLTVTKQTPKMISLSAKKNESSDKLETSITVYTTDGECIQNVPVTLAPDDTPLTVSGLDAPFDAAKGSVETAQELNISCGSSWTISGKPDWLDISALSGTGKTTVKVWPNSANNSTSDRSATLTIKSGSKTVTKKVVQRAGYSSVYARPTNIVVLTNSLVYGYNFHQNTHKVYFTLLTKMESLGYTDNDIVYTLQTNPNSDIWTSRSPEQFNQNGSYFAWTGLTPNIEYVLISVAVDKNNMIGEINRHSFVTISAAKEYSPYISIENIQASVGYDEYGQVSYRIQAEKDAVNSGYADKIYTWAVAGTKYFSTLAWYESEADAILAYLVMSEINKNPNPHDTYINGEDRNIVRERLEGPVPVVDFTLPANYLNDKYLQIVTWCTLSSGAFSGTLTSWAASINANSSTPTMQKMGKNRSNSNAPRLIQFDPQKLQEKLELIRIN